jgi:hypothetical protein
MWIFMGESKQREEKSSRLELDVVFCVHVNENQTVVMGAGMREL